MAKGKNVHVVPRPEGWAIVKEGNERATKVTPTKKEAVDAARPIARQNESELVIHNKDGKIANSDSHGHDPNPPKDTK
jgi:hypothetical protein